MTHWVLFSQIQISFIALSDFEGQVEILSDFRRGKTIRTLNGDGVTIVAAERWMAVIISKRSRA